MPGNASETPDHLSPCSVLEPLFDEDDIMVRASSGRMKPNSRGAQILFSYPVLGLKLLFDLFL